MKKAAIAISLLCILYCGNTYSQIPRAKDTRSLIDSMIEREKPFTNWKSKPLCDGCPWFNVIPGSKPILILAPHATPQTREGKIKIADGGSGSLAITLAKATGATVIYTTYLSPQDPNYYDDNDFKQKVKEVVSKLKPKIVLDLHVSDSKRPYDIDFGTRHDTSLVGRHFLLDTLKYFCNQAGIMNLSKDFFAASEHQTDTKWVSNLGTPCIQCEINATMVMPDQGDIYAERSSQLLNALISYFDWVRDVK